MLDQFEYTFFDESIAKHFAEACRELGLSTQISVEEAPTGEGVFEVQVQDALSDELAEQIEDIYSEMLFGQQAAQIEGNDGEALADVCGVQVQLASGEFTTVAIHPKIMNKILSVLTIDELQKFLAQVAEDIENPKSGPICRREHLPDL
ncbi:MAG: hypothetical protein JXK16_00245 [Thiotrichales bacterium]|nr:hypothetical protein [Thiotrichales bacterium]